MRCSTTGRWEINDQAVTWADLLSYTENISIAVNGGGCSSCPGSLKTMLFPTTSAFGQKWKGGLLLCSRDHGEGWQWWDFTKFEEGKRGSYLPLLGLLSKCEWVGSSQVWFASFLFQVSPSATAETWESALAEGGREGDGEGKADTSPM